jgi:hypothetical protein
MGGCSNNPTHLPSKTSSYCSTMMPTGCDGMPLAITTNVLSPNSVPDEVGKMPNWVLEIAFPVATAMVLELLATRKSDGTTLAIEHTLLESFVGNKRDFAQFEPVFPSIKDDQSLLCIHGLEPIGYRFQTATPSTAVQFPKCQVIRHEDYRAMDERRAIKALLRP